MSAAKQRQDAEETLLGLAQLVAQSIAAFDPDAWEDRLHGFTASVGGILADRRRLVLVAVTGI